jgi:soluble lytic murein transglycosylase-like protein
VSAKSGVPREYLEHALQLENSGEHAVSPKGAKGRFQIMKENLRQGEDPTNFEVGANAAARVLHDAISLYGHDERAVMAYYNGGREQGDLVHSGANPSNKETRNYVSRLDKLNGKNA